MLACHAVFMLLLVEGDGVLKKPISWYEICFMFLRRRFVGKWKKMLNPQMINQKKCFEE